MNPIPDGYHSVQPYLMIDGALQAIEFYKKAFGATERLCMKQPDGRVSHAEIQMGDSCIMLADDNAELMAFSPKHYGGSSVSLQFYTDDCHIPPRDCGRREKRSRTCRPVLWRSHRRSRRSVWLYMVDRHSHQRFVEGRIGKVVRVKSREPRLGMFEYSGRWRG